MVPTNDISVFLEENDVEFRDMVSRQCEYMNYPGSPDDVVQDLYMRFITTKKIIEVYDASINVQMSTYLFKIIKNFIISRLKSHDGRFYGRRVSTPVPTSDTDEFDLVSGCYDVSTDYLNTQFHNDETVNSLNEKLHDFDRFFSDSPRNVKYALKKRKYKRRSWNYLKFMNRLKNRNRIGDEYDVIKDMISNIEKDGCTLIDLFRLLYRGYTNKQIARIYGVSKTTISAMKYKLSRAMNQFGIVA